MVGKLIVLEGLDSSGKATQTELVVQRILKKGKEAIKMDFPQYGNWSAGFVERYLNGEFGPFATIDPKVASLFFALDRYTAKKTIEEALDKGKIIVANRYTTSNQGYQAAKVKEKDEQRQVVRWIEEIEYKVLGLPKPDIVIYLHLPLKKTLELMDKRKQKEYIRNGQKDQHEDDHAFLESAQQVYNDLAKSGGWIIIECVENDKLLTKDQIHEKIWVEIEKRI